MKKYEIMCVFAPQDESYAEGLASVKKTLSEHNAVIEKEEDMGVREIAGTIDKHTHAHYLYFITQLDPSSVVELNKSFKLIQHLLRVLIINRSKK